MADTDCLTVDDRGTGASEIEAVAIDNLDRTRSKGYVEPVKRYFVSDKITMNAFA